MVHGAMDQMNATLVFKLRYRSRGVGRVGEIRKSRGPQAFFGFSFGTHLVSFGVWIVDVGVRLADVAVLGLAGYITAAFRGSTGHNAYSYY